MRILRFLLFIIFILFIAVAIWLKLSPGRMEIREDGEIHASIGEVFNEFNDVQNYTTWNNLYTRDSKNTKINYFYPYYGKDAAFSWNNNALSSSVGSGDYRIVKSEKNKYIEAEFIYSGINTAGLEKITFTPEGENKTKLERVFVFDKLSYRQKIMTYFSGIKLKLLFHNTIEDIEKHIELKKGGDITQISDRVLYTNVASMKILGIELVPSEDEGSYIKQLHENYNELDRYLRDSLNYSGTKEYVIYHGKKDSVSSNASYVGYVLKTRIDFKPTPSIELIDLPKGDVLSYNYNGNLSMKKEVQENIAKYAVSNHLAINNSYLERFNALPSNISSVGIFRYMYYIEN